MIVPRLALGALAAAYLAVPAPAADKPIRTLLGVTPPAPKAPKAYPLAENRYIKQFAGPSISCGACFGFYHTQWRSWEEACNEPRPAESGPLKSEVPVEPVVEVEKPVAPKVEKPKEPAPAPVPVPKTKEKLPEPKPAEKKKVEALPVIPVPLPALQPAAINAVQIAIPVAPPIVPPPAKPIPVLTNDPMPTLPTIIVPLNSK